MKETLHETAKRISNNRKLCVGNCMGCKAKELSNYGIDVCIISLIAECENADAQINLLEYFAEFS